MGVGRDASDEAIRLAYRRRAQAFHPDRNAGTADDGAMSAVNEAYRVLSEPGRRAIYDRSLAAGVGGSSAVEPASARPPSNGSPDNGWVPYVADADEPRSGPGTWVAAPGPARVPWKLMLGVATAGSLLVLVGSFFNDPPSEEPPDGILRNGSCVQIEPNTDVREVQCTGEGDRIVELLIPIDAVCPVGTEAHRDRLGLGTACLAMIAD